VLGLSTGCQLELSAYSSDELQELSKWLCHDDRQTPFNGLFSWTTWVSQQQKGSTSQDFNEARDGSSII